MVVYSWGGQPFLRRGRYLHGRAGNPVGYFTGEGLVFDFDGTYLGELVADRLAKVSGSSEKGSRHVAVPARLTATAVATAKAASPVEGYEEFTGEA